MPQKTLHELVCCTANPLVHASEAWRLTCTVTAKGAHEMMRFMAKGAHDVTCFTTNLLFHPQKR